MKPILFAMAVALTLAVGLAACAPAGAQAPGWPQITLEQVASGLVNPVDVANAGDGSARLFVVEQPGRVRIVSGGALLTMPFLDITDRVGSTGTEQGLLSVAFPPGYAQKRYFYVDYTNKQGNTTVSRFHVTADANVADPASEEQILLVDQPYANHNGGQLAFGPDGYLYIGLGDGGSGGDPGNRAQNPDVLLGKILRLDVESGQAPYAIPPSNPFVGVTGKRGEIWALGLRNPWRFSFDRQTGDLYIGDVGQNAYEEIDLQGAGSAGGENYGWRILEGNHCYNPSTGCTPPANYVAPIIEEAHTDGWVAIVGGMVYRGSAFPGLTGIYIYGDWGAGWIYGARRNGSAWETSLLVSTGHRLTSFGEDEQGELYVAMRDSGQVFRVVEVTPPRMTWQIPLVLKDWG